MREEVLALLDRYRPFPPEEAAVEVFRALLSSADPLSRYQFEPGHFTASGFVLSPDRRAVLLIDHRRLGRWMQPGGHIDPGDRDPLAAARREIGEETGLLDLQPIVRGLFGLADHPIPARHDEPPHRHYDLKFAFVARATALEASDEVAGAAWVPMDDIELYRIDAETRHGVYKLRTLS
jgi:8-oxo-dGTP pyrophosphatase MutT (NUDIX family)